MGSGKTTMISKTLLLFALLQVCSIRAKNANKTIESNIGGEDEPCDSFKCDMKVFAVFQKSKGRVPIKKAGECCASEWDCSTWEERLKHKDKCFIVSKEHPRGKLYKLGESVPDITGAGCYCSGKPNSDEYAEPYCNHIDHASNFGWYPPHHVRCWNTPGCELHGDECICGKELKRRYKEESCEYEGKKYIWGQTISKTKEPCVSCKCQKGWNGTLAEPFCSIRESCHYTYDNVEHIANCKPKPDTKLCCALSFAGDRHWKC